MEGVDLLVVLMLILFVAGAKPVYVQNCINEEYLSTGTGKALRGFFSIMVVFHHLALTNVGGYVFHHFTCVGYLCVAVFFFLSGYGLQKSYIISENYKIRFLQKRLTKILLPYVLVTVLYWIAHAVYGEIYSLGDIFKGILTGTPIVSNSWYIISICYFYIAFWVFMKIPKKNYQIMIIYAFLWVFAYVALCMLLGYGSWWYNTVPLLVLGMIWACYEDKILRVIKKHYGIIVLGTIVLFSALCFSKIFCSSGLLLLCSTMLTAVLFVLLVLLALLKIKIGNSVLVFLGDISLELYLLHGLWIAVVRSGILYIENGFILSVVVLCGSIVSALVLHKMIGIFFNLTKRKSM